ncbi:hypothetical protein [Staphylococcus gallinarum]|nr:hypothetical protein [Staphylococcus gallinarum]MCD8787457.1 hypothetical protein [Staphylococcus gallinarum]MCD8845264.1 hypothetical protein [Staphylococcus gallinarum]
MNDKQLEQIIKNQELIITMLYDLKQVQPTLNVAELSKIREYNRGV